MAMSDTATQLRDLFDPSQARQLDIIREALLTDPKALDNHTRKPADTPSVK